MLSLLLTVHYKNYQKVYKNLTKMIPPIKYKGLPEMTHTASKEFDRIMETLGKKTKREFIHALHVELHGRPDNSILNYADIVDVAKTQKFI